MLISRLAIKVNTTQIHDKFRAQGRFACSLDVPNAYTEVKVETKSTAFKAYDNTFVIIICLSVDAA